MNDLNDDVNHPAHYTNQQIACVTCRAMIECIDITQHMNFNTGNAIKYVWRHKYKGNPIKDLQKAVWYLNKEIERLQIKKEAV